MASDKKPKKPRHYTDKLKCLYPRVTKPDNKYPKPGQPDGEYSIQLLATPEQAEALTKQLSQEVEEQAAIIRSQEKKYAKWKIAWPIKDQVDKDTDEPTGLKIIKLSQARTVVPQDTSKKAMTFTVSLVDSKGVPIPNPEKLQLGSGSTVRCCFDVRVAPNKLPGFQNLAVKFQLKAVQIIDLVAYAAEDYDFEEEAGGYEASPGEEPTEGGASGEEKPNGDF